MLDRIGEVLRVLAYVVQFCPDCRRPWSEPAPIASHAVCPVSFAQAQSVIEQQLRALRSLRRRT
jgi:hypothetical protein